MAPSACGRCGDGDIAVAVVLRTAAPGRVIIPVVTVRLSLSQPVG